MFGDSNLSKLISSFEDLRKVSKKCFNTQTKTYSTLEQWANESNNNTAIQDVSNKMALLFHKFESEFKGKKSNAYLNLVNIFKKFKEYDNDLKNELKEKNCLDKKELKYYEKIQKCTSNQNVYDYEIKYNKTRAEREKIELKINDLKNDIETTKSILFKKNMKMLVETLKKHNEAEQVLIQAMEELINQIPDISNEEVDDLSEIEYKNRDKTDLIFSNADEMLQKLSSSCLKPLDKSQSLIRLKSLLGQTQPTSSDRSGSDEEESDEENEVTQSFETKYRHSSTRSISNNDTNIARIQVTHNHLYPLIDFGECKKKEEKEAGVSYQSPPPAYTASIWSTAGQSICQPSAPSLDLLEQKVKKTLRFESPSKCHVYEISPTRRI